MPELCYWSECVQAAVSTLGRRRKFLLTPCQKVPSLVELKCEY